MENWASSQTNEAIISKISDLCPNSHRVMNLNVQVFKRLSSEFLKIDKRFYLISKFNINNYDKPHKQKKKVINLFSLRRTLAFFPFITAKNSVYEQTTLNIENNKPLFCVTITNLVYLRRQTIIFFSGLNYHLKVVQL